jgi:hypothetical protein
MYICVQCVLAVYEMAIYIIKQYINMATYYCLYKHNKTIVHTQFGDNLQKSQYSSVSTIVIVLCTQVSPYNTLAIVLHCFSRILEFPL